MQYFYKNKTDITPSEKSDIEKTTKTERFGAYIDSFGAVLSFPLWLEPHPILNYIRDRSVLQFPKRLNSF